MKCAKYNECSKVKAILDKDLLDFQYADALRKICKNCEYQPMAITACKRSGGTDICIGEVCGLYKRCYEN